MVPLSGVDTADFIDVDFLGDDRLGVEDNSMISRESTILALATAREQSPFFSGCASTNPTPCVSFVEAAFFVTVVFDKSVFVGVRGSGLWRVERFEPVLVLGAGGRRFGGIIDLSRSTMISQRITTGCEQLRICAIGELSPIKSTKGAQDNVSAKVCEP